MSLPAPPVDPRRYDDIVRQTERLAQHFTAATASAWRPRGEGDSGIDAGQALIRIFGHMAALVIERLNRAPEKNFLAFLNLIGTHPLPPQPARAPVTFQLASASTTAGFVPARTRVAALPEPDDREEVVFETERDLVVTPARLTAVWVYEPAAGRYADYTSVALSGTDAASFTPFVPFVPTVDTQPALYLGFDRSFNNRPISLYVQVAHATPEEREAWRQGSATSGSTRLVWEYASANNGWQSLGAVDETQGFSVSGVVEFVAPVDFLPHHEFGQTRYWLRVRREGESLVFIPRLQRLLTNTTWASQGVTLENEILGSSNGEPKQTFRSAYAPVLLQPAVSLQVREPEPPSAQERLALTAAVGANALAARRESDGRTEGVWVPWWQVADFYDSTPQDRHYLLDHLTGAVSFGDGQQGRVPPRGRDNIRLQRYRSGGGAHGNRPVATITQLKTTLPYVAAVSNPEAASGGADAEPLERVVERGPKTLRHRHRAVTAQDLEDLAFEASPAVARARAVTPTFNPVELPWRPLFHLNVTQPGKINAELRWQDAKSLAMALYGPGRGNAYARVQGASPLRLSYTVESTRFQPGERWWVAVTNAATEYVSGVSLKLAYPVGMIDSSFQVPSQNTPEVSGAGRSQLIIVPQASGSRPMPSPRLLRQVEAYVRARCGADMALWVREPHWLEVTVEAQVVGAAGHNPDNVRVAVAAELTRFLHPLSGAKTGRGWPFGRLPQKSDVYALLESVPGVDHVRSLSILQPEVAPSERQRFLIFSGQHRISMGISGRL